MPLQVFISYKSEYRDFARKLKGRIREWGYGTWFDVDDIAEGTYFRHAIQNGLEKSDVMVGVLTEDAFRSREVQAEWDYFFIKNKEFIPLRYQAVEPPYHLLTIQYIDFINDETAAFDKLHKRLGELAVALQKEVVVVQKPGATTAVTTETEERGGEREEEKPSPLANEPAAEEAALADKKRKREALDDEVVVVATPLLRPPKPITPAAPPAEQSADKDEERKQDRLDDGIFSPPPAPITQPTTAPVPQPVTPPSPIPQVIGGVQAPTIQPQRQSSTPPPAQPASRAKSSPILWPLAAVASVVVLVGAVLLYAVNASMTISTTPPESGTSPLVWVGLVAVLGVVSVGVWWRFSRRKVSAVPQPAAADDDNRATMLNNVAEFWLKGVLEPALEAGQFEMGLSSAPGAVLRHKDYGDYALPANADILTIFNDLNRELLILGAPGGGKTVLLLQLASKLIEIARQDVSNAIPIVFNLSSWAAGRKPLAEWLVEELRLKYQVPKKMATAWIEGEQLLLLLDGLDEVAEQHRNECVDAINTFREKYRTVDLAICSRILDYDALTSKLDVRGAVVLEPLTQPVIDAYLDRPELATLRQVIATDTELQTMSEVPFLLNAMAYAYAGSTPTDLQVPASADTVKTRRTHLFDRWVEKRLAARPSVKYTPSKVRQWLGWLSGKLVNFKQTVFYIEGLHPEWLDITNKSIFGKLKLILTVNLAFGIGGSLFFGATNALIGGIILLGSFFTSARQIFPNILGFIGVVILFTVGGFIPGILMGFPLSIKFLNNKELKISDTLAWSWSRFRWGGLIIGVISAILLSLIIALFAGVPFLETIYSMEEIDLAQSVYQIGDILTRNLQLGIVVGLVSGYFIGGILSGLTGKALDQRTKPNEGIKHSFNNMLLLGLVSNVAFGLTWTMILFAAGNDIGVFENRLLGWPILAFTLILIMVIGLLFSVRIGGSTVIKHAVIRFLLWRSGDAPWNYVRFLDYCASAGLMRKVGGGYIFAHRYLLEYFADLSHPTNPSP